MRKECVDAIRGLFEEEGFIQRCVNLAESLPHVMEFTRIRILESMFALVRKGISNVLEYNESHPDFPLSVSQVEDYMTKWL